MMAIPPLTHPTGVAHLKTFVGLSGRETQQSVTGVGFHSSTQPTRRCTKLAVPRHYALLPVPCSLPYSFHGQVFYQLLVLGFILQPNLRLLHHFRCVGPLLAWHT
ncbi:MAG: hypothetical protein F6K55_34480 [Moorea sp. SIO4A3]|nr:hypothetical protein [Moorena sp. SIO4A3]